MEKNRYLIFLGLSALLICGSIFALPITKIPSKAPISIGAIYNLTGEQSPIDAPSARGVRLAVHMINVEGGLKGHRLKLVLKNGHSDPKIIAHIASQFAKDPHIQVIVGLNGSNMVKIAAPILAKNKKIFISSAATDQNLIVLNPKYLFLTCFTNDIQASAAAEYAYQFLNYEKVAVLYDNTTEYGRTLSEFFEKRFAELDGQILSSQSLKHGDRRVAPQINNLLKIKNDIKFIYLASGPSDAPYIIRSLRKAGLSMPIIGGDSFVATEIIKVLGSTADNISFTTHAVINPEFVDLLPALMRQYVATKKFFYEYKIYYGREPRSVFSALGYDAVNVLVTALSDSKSYTNTNDILYSLHHLTTFVGVTGKVSYEYGQRVPKKTVSIVDIQNGKAYFLGNWIPSVVPKL